MWLLLEKHCYILSHFLFTSLYTFFPFILKPVIILKSDYQVYHLPENLHSSYRKYSIYIIYHWNTWRVSLFPPSPHPSLIDLNILPSFFTGHLLLFSLLSVGDYFNTFYLKTNASAIIMSWEAVETAASLPIEMCTEIEKHMDLVLYFHLLKVNELKIENGIKVCFINQFVKLPDDHN